MRKLIILLLITILIAGCTGLGTDNQTTEVGKLILNQDQIKTVTVVKGSTYAKTFKLSDSVDISDLLGMIDKIGVKRLSKQEDMEFVPGRIQEVHLDVSFDDTNNPVRSLQGAFSIWPDGYIYAVDVDSMTGNQRTISYLSESKYPEIYKWIAASLNQ